MATSILTDVHKYLSTQLKKEEPAEAFFPWSVHPSALPFCGLRLFYDTICGVQGSSSFDSDYFMTVGSTIHELLQHWLAGDRFFGRFVCEDEDCVRHAAPSPITNNPLCPKCGKRRIYKEVKLAYKEDARTKLDGIFRDYEKGWWVIEFKSTSTDLIRNYRRSRKGLPHEANLWQARMATAIADRDPQLKEAKIGPLKGFILCYFSRNRPSSEFVCLAYRMGDEEKEEWISLTDDCLVQFHAVQSLLEKGNSSLKLANVLVKGKLCSSSADYADRIEPLLWGDCPLSMDGVCFSMDGVCFSKALLIQNIKDVWKEYLAEKGESSE